jgi:hypothetical protein
VLALRESRLQRRASDRLAPAPGADPVPQPAGSVEPPDNASPPSRPGRPGAGRDVPVPPPDEDVPSALRAARVVPYLLIAVAVYAPVGRVLATSQAGWLVLGSGLLVLSLASFVLARRAPAAWRSTADVVAVVVGAMSIGSVFGLFWPPTGRLPDTLAGSAVLVVAAVVWILIARLRDHRTG